MAILVSAARTAFIRLKKDLSDVGSPIFVEWCDFINKFLYRKLIDTDMERFVASTTFTVTAEPQTLPLPSNFKTIQPIGTGFFLRDDSGDDTDQELGRTGFGRRDKGFYITGTNVVFTGFQDGGSTTIVLRYIPTQTKLTLSTQYFTVDGLTGGIEIIPEEYLNNLIKALDVFYTQWDEVPGDESLADFRYVRVLNELFDSIRKEADAYSLPDYTLIF